MLGDYRIERVYMILLIIAAFFNRDKRYIAHSINKMVLLFFFALLISAIAALSWDASYDRTFDYFKLLVFYFIIIFSIKDERDLKNFILAYLVIMLLYTGKSAWEFFVHDRYVWRMGIKRMIGFDTTYGDSNAFAASIAYSLPFLWAVIKCKLDQPWLRRALWTYGALSLVCIIYTGSRSGMVTTLLFFMLALMGSSRKMLGIMFLSIALVFVWHSMPETYQDRFMTTFHADIESAEDLSSADMAAAGSAQGRIYTFKRGIEMFIKYPLLGVGPGNYPNGLRLFGDYSGLNAHNLYGMLLGETGILGSAAFIILIAAIIKTHIRIIRMSKTTNDTFYQLVSIAAIQAIVLLLFNGNFGGNLYRYNWLWIGAIGVLSAHFLENRKTDIVTQKPSTFRK